jgi:hypothetical protein
MVDRHEREIFPLMKKRYLFSGSSDFCLYDMVSPEGTINENVFAYSNRYDGEMALVFYNNAYSRASGWIRRGAVGILQKDGSYRQDDLCQALSFHREDRYFALFREHRSGLWYIRSSKDLGERGFFAALNGYETQVFLEIHEAADAPDAEPGSWAGRWARLNYELNGRGVRDLHEAILDIYLGELYAPLKDIFANEHIEALSRFFMGHVPPHPANGEDPEAAETTGENSREKNTAFIESFREPVIAFVNAAAKFLNGDGKGYEPFNTAENPPASASVPTPVPVPTEEIWRDFVGFIERIILLSEAPESAPLKERPWAVSLALGYGVLTLLRPILGKGTSGAPASALADHWQLIRKLRESWEHLGIPESEARRIGALAQSVLARSCPETTQSLHADPGTLAAALILENYDTGDFRAALGLNRFDDATWFNKEAFEETLTWVPVFLLSEGIIAAPTIRAVAGSLRNAEDPSGYRLDELLGILTGRKEDPKEEKDTKAAKQKKRKK